MAWLHATPTAKGQPRPIGAMSRLQALHHEGAAVPLPEPGPAAHLLDHLFDAGPVMHGGMGAAPLSYGELHAWSALRGIDLEPWEFKLMRDLSRAYAAESSTADNPSAAPPWVEIDQTADARKAVSDRIRAALGGRSKRALQ